MSADVKSILKFLLRSATLSSPMLPLVPAKKAHWLLPLTRSFWWSMCFWKEVSNGRLPCSCCNKQRCIVVAMRSLVSKFDSVKSNEKVPSIFCTEAFDSSIHSNRILKDSVSFAIRWRWQEPDSISFNASIAASEWLLAIHLLGGMLLTRYREQSCWAYWMKTWRKCWGSVEEVCGCVFWRILHICVFLLVNSNSFSLQTPHHHDLWILWMWFGQVYGKRGLLCCSH